MNNFLSYILLRLGANLLYFSFEMFSEFWLHYWKRCSAQSKIEVLSNFLNKMEILTFPLAPNAPIKPIDQIWAQIKGSDQI